MTNRFDRGIVQDADFRVDGQGLPTVLRDGRGRVRWKLSENTPEQNEQIGIKNVQGMFLENFPEFNELFPREEDGVIAEDRREEAKKFIKEREAFFEGSCINKDTAPYFLGRRQILLQKSFAPWGVMFEIPPQVNKSTKIYTDENNEEWAPLKPISLLLQTDTEKIKRLTTVRTRQGMTSSGQQATLYSLHDIKAQLGDYFSLSSVDKETGRWQDENQDSWVVITALSDDAGISTSLARKTLENHGINPIPGKDKSGTRALLYREREAREILGKVANLPQVDKTTGVFSHDGEQISMVPIIYLRKKHGIDYYTVKKLLKNAVSSRGRSKTGAEADLYFETEADEIINRYKSLPKIDKDSGRYLDIDDQSWRTILSLARENGLTHATVQRRIKSVRFMHGRARGVDVTVLYNEREALDAINSFLILPSVSKDRGIFIDEKEKKEWCSIMLLVSITELDHATVTSKLKKNGVSTIPGRAISGKEVALFDKKRALEVLMDQATSHRINRETHQGIDEEGNTLVTIKFFLKQFRINREWLAPYIGSLRSISGRDEAGREAALYRYRDVMEIIAQNGLLDRRDRLDGRKNQQKNISSKDATIDQIMAVMLEELERDEV